MRSVHSALAAALAFVASGCARPAPTPPPTPGPDACTGVSPATPLRLLTRAEYGNTVRDLLGDTLQPQSAFPAEPLVRGFDNDATVVNLTGEGASRVLEAAELLAATTLRDRRGLVVPCTGQDDGCRDDFLRTFGLRAWRRPLTAAETSGLSGFFDQVRAQNDFDTAVEWTVEVMLQAPQFLDRDEVSVAQSPAGRVELDDYQLATRLSYFLWASTPDDTLREAAAQGQLRSAEGLDAQANRLLDDPRALDGYLRFFALWLDFDGAATTEKNPAAVPDWTPAMSAAWQTSLGLFVRDALLHGGTLTDLLTSNALFANEALNAYVGGGMGAEFQRVTMPAAQRGGVLTQPGLLARLSAPGESSPIRRGNFVLDRLLCQPTPAPPSGVPVTPPPLSTTGTTRQRFEAHGSVAPCNTCHALIDPVGFTFEHYDAIGAWRDLEHGLPIDATGGVTAAADASLVQPVDGAVELSRVLAQSRQVHDCVAKEVFRFALGRVPTDADDCALAQVRERFAESHGSFRALALAIVRSDAFRAHTPVEVAP